ncbi:hypothetical protein ACFW95_07845 [Streptomyces sp. NPDC059474]
MSEVMSEGVVGVMSEVMSEFVSEFVVVVAVVGMPVAGRRFVAELLGSTG